MTEQEIKKVLSDIAKNEITELNLAGKNINSEQAQNIADALAKNTSIKSLDLSNNKIGPVGYRAFAEMFKKNKTIENFKIFGNQKMGRKEKGALKIIWNLEDFRTVNLFNQIEVNSVANSRSSSLEPVSKIELVQGIAETAKTADEPVKAETQSKEFEKGIMTANKAKYVPASKNSIDNQSKLKSSATTFNTDAALLSKTAKSTTVDSIDTIFVPTKAVQAQTVAEPVKAEAQSKKIEKGIMTAKTAVIEKTTAESKVAAPSVEVIEQEDVPVGVDNQIESLRDRDDVLFFKDITAIDTNEISVSLMTETRYKILVIDNCNVTDEEAIELATALEVSTIREVYLSHNKIGDDGATALVSAVMKNKTQSITHIDLSYNQVSELTTFSLTSFQATYSQRFTLNISHQAFEEALVKSDAAYAEKLHIEETNTFIKNIPTYASPVSSESDDEDTAEDVDNEDKPKVPSQGIKFDDALTKRIVDLEQIQHFINNHSIVKAAFKLFGLDKIISDELTALRQINAARLNNGGDVSDAYNSINQGVYAKALHYTFFPKALVGASKSEKAIKEAGAEIETKEGAIEKFIDLKL